MIIISTILHINRFDAFLNSNQELEIEISASYEPQRDAQLHGHPDTWSPAEGGMEIIQVNCKTIEFSHLFEELTQQEKDMAAELLGEQLSEPDDSYDDEDYNDYDLTIGDKELAELDKLYENEY